MNSLCCPGLREWSIGALQITSASLTGLGERNFTGALRINIEDGASGTRPLLDRQDTSRELEFLSRSCLRLAWD
jgi:hypothetical protein